MLKVEEFVAGSPILQGGEKVTQNFLAQEPRLFNRLALTACSNARASHAKHIYLGKSDICQMWKEEVVLIS